MRAASAQWQRRARGAHTMPSHRPLRLRVMRRPSYLRIERTFHYAEASPLHQTTPISGSPRGTQRSLSQQL